LLGQQSEKMGDANLQAVSTMRTHEFIIQRCAGSTVAHYETPSIDVLSGNKGSAHALLGAFRDRGKHTGKSNFPVLSKTFWLVSI
jgi:hypothetical protein